MPQVKSEGIILKSVNWKEHSKIVTMFTDNAGRQSIVERGGRSFKSKRGRLQTFTRLELIWFKSEKSGMGYLAEVEPLESFSFEQEGTLGRLTFASAVVEMLYDLLPEDEPHEDLYNLTIDYLRKTDTTSKAGIIPVFLAYFLKLLSYLGYRPNFSGCISCGKESGKALFANSNGLDYYIFSPERGGIICGTCQIPGEYYIRLHSERLDEIYGLQTASLAEAAETKLKLEAAEEILELLNSFLKYQTDIGELKSLKFLEKLKKEKFK